MSELYSLPNGWEWKSLNEVFIVKDGTHDSPKYIEENGYPLITSKNLRENGLDYSNFKLISEEDYIKINQRSKVDKGDLLFAMIGTIGNPTIIEQEPNFAIKNVALFKPMNIENKIEFLRYYFLSNFVIDKMINEANGATQKFVGLTYLRNFLYPQPPLEEQKRIVAKLDILFEKIDKAIALHQKNIDEADIFMASVLNDVFVELEEKYEKYRLEDLTSLITKGTTPTTNGYKFQDSGINFLKIENIVNGEIDLSTIEMFISEEAHQSQKRSQLEINDVLFSIAGTIGDTAIVKKEHLPMNTNQAIALIRPIEKLNSEFLRRLLSSSISNETTNKQRGGAIKNVSLGDIKELELPLPPLQTQQKVVSYLDEISNKMEKIKNLQKKKMQSLKELKASILDKAFKGEL